MARVTVRGRNAAELQGYLRLFTRILFGLILIVIICIVVDFGQRTPLLFIGAGLGVAVAVVGIAFAALWVITNLRELSEVRHGYTTMEIAHQDVEERDPRTGRVIRAAGEPYLTPEVRAARLAEPSDPTSAPEGPLLPGRARIYQPPGTRITIAIAAVIGLITLILRLSGVFSPH